MDRYKSIQVRKINATGKIITVSDSKVKSNVTYSDGVRPVSFFLVTAQVWCALFCTEFTYKFILPSFIIVIIHLFIYYFYTNVFN